MPNSTENQTEFVFEYLIKDYTSTRSSYTQWPPLSTGLGNVRAVITEENATFEDKFLATMEDVYASIEENNFENVELTREDLPIGYPIDASVEFNERIARLTAANGTQMGPSIVMPVKNGEKVSLSASYFYEENAPGQTYDNLGLLVNEVLLALASSGAGILPLNESQLGILAIGGEGYGSDIYNLLASNIDTTNMDRPHAYVVYVYYDQQMNILPAISGAIRVQNPNQLETILRSEMQVQRNGYLHAYVSNGGTAPVHFDNMMVSLIQGKVRQFNDYYPYGLSISGVNGVNGSYKNMYTSKELQNGEFASGRGLEMYDFDARFYDPQLGRWFAPDPAEQFYNPYLAMGNNPVSYVDPDGEFAILAALIIKGVILAAKAAKVATVAAKAGAVAAKAGAVAAKSATKIGIKAGLKSGSINTISNYDSEEGLGWHTLGDFAAGYAGGSFGVGFDSKLIGMGIGGAASWGVNGASFDYQGGQEFVGGALSTFVGMDGAVKGKHALFKQSEGVKTLAKFDNSNLITNTLKKHGDNFLKYGLQNNAYDFAYTKEEDFRKRQGGHLDLFLWGGVSGAFQRHAWAEEIGFGMSPLYLGIDWSINGAIKKRYEGIKIDGSQGNKLGLNYYKWMLEMINFAN